MASGPIFPAAWQIPVDYTVRKGLAGITRGDITVYDAYGNLRFRVCTHGVPSSPWRAKTLLDALGNPLITCVRDQRFETSVCGNPITNISCINLGKRKLMQSQVLRIIYDEHPFYHHLHVMMEFSLPLHLRHQHNSLDVLNRRLKKATETLLGLL